MLNNIYLVRQLNRKSLGVGIGVIVPQAWSGHRWEGSGRLDNSLVDCLRSRLRGGGSLPPVQLLASWPDLESAALRAMDLEAPERLPCLFHADDPLFVGSSQGALSEMLEVVEEWCASCGAAFHVSAKKTVLMSNLQVTPSVAWVAYGGILLIYVTEHRWLGPIWEADLRFAKFLRQRLALGSSMVAQLAGLTCMGAIPWLAVCTLFWSKVDSILDMGRWLFIMVPNAQEIIDESYVRWSRVLLGADWWRNPGACTSELGISLSGFARVVYAVAIKRAKL